LSFSVCKIPIYFPKKQTAFYLDLWDFVQLRSWQQISVIVSGSCFYAPAKTGYRLNSKVLNLEIADSGIGGVLLLSGLTGALWPRFCR